MMKLSQEERTGFITGINKYFIVAIFLVLSDPQFAQIPFKGFCRLTTINVDSGYTRLFSFNFDQDEYSDLISYNPVEKSAKLYHGKPGLKFEFKKNIFFPLQPSRLIPVSLNNSMIEGYAFTSRKNRSFGIYKFTKDGNPELINHIKFESYPEFISIGDIDNNGVPEFLLSGNAFNGLSVIYKGENKLEEQKIISGITFSNAQFMDFNGDEFSDIIALSSVDNSLHFFYNNGNSEFTELRKIYIDEDVLSLRIFDLNDDSFPDIIVSTTSSIKIYYGDPANPYQKIISIKTLYPANDFVLGDFNRDGYFDFNCLNISEGIVYTIFAKDFYSFYPELLQTESKGTTDIIPFFSKFVYGTALINKTGIIAILSKMISVSDDQKLVLGITPDVISQFDLTNNGITDFVFTDRFDQKLKFIIRDASGSADKLFTINLNTEHKNIFEFNNSKSVKTFFCYSEGERVIETIEVNFDNYSYKREYFYTEGPIEDLIVASDNSGNAEIFVLYSKEKSLNYEIFSKTTLRYSSKTYKNIANNWFSPVIVSTNQMLVSFWSKNGDFLSFNLANLKVNNYDIKQFNKVKNRDFSIISESNNTAKNNSYDFISLLSGSENISVLSGLDNYKIVTTLEHKFSFRITNKNHLFFNNTNAMFVNDLINKNFYKLSINTTKKILRITKLFDSINMDNFVISSLDQRNYHIIYTDKKFINIRQLPQ